jgi:outer membrane lipoprotein-sorting protein
MRRFILYMICAAALISFVARAESAQEILDRTRATYASLQTYSDTGVVINEYGASSQDQHTFKTWFSRNPRHFLLDFRKQGGDRFVIWGDPDAFHTWWKTTAQQYDYPNPNNVTAISGSAQNTHSTALKVPTLLYGKSALAAMLLDVADPALSGTEDTGGKRCFRVTGTASERYAASGREVNRHKIVFWIDRESYLIWKVVEEWTALPGQRSRVTTIFQPVANPSLAEQAFRFAPPAK